MTENMDSCLKQNNREKSKISEKELEQLKIRLEINHEKQSKLTDAYLDNLLSEEMFKVKNEELREEEEELQKRIALQELKEIERECLRRLGKLKRAVQAGDERYVELMRDFPRLWDAATVEERKGLLRSIFSVIWVEDGEIVGYEPRDPFVPLLPESESTIVAGQIEQVTDRLAQLPSP